MYINSPYKMINVSLKVLSKVFIKQQRTNEIDNKKTK